MSENAKTQTELLQELVTALEPVTELAKYYINNINSDIARNQIINDYVKAQQEKQTEEAND